MVWHLVRVFLAVDSHWSVAFRLLSAGAEGQGVSPSPQFTPFAGRHSSGRDSSDSLAGVANHRVLWRCYLAARPALAKRVDFLRLLLVQLVYAAIHRPRFHQARRVGRCVEFARKLVDVADLATWGVRSEPPSPPGSALVLPPASVSARRAATRLLAAVLAAVARSSSCDGARAGIVAFLAVDDSWLSDHSFTGPIGVT